jgi:hypothetical protein
MITQANLIQELNSSELLDSTTRKQKNIKLTSAKVMEIRQLNYSESTINGYKFPTEMVPTVQREVEKYTKSLNPLHKDEIPMHSEDPEGEHQAFLLEQENFLLDMIGGNANIPFWKNFSLSAIDTITTEDYAYIIIKAELKGEDLEGPYQNCPILQANEEGETLTSTFYLGTLTIIHVFNF